MERVVLMLGSNLGDREANLETACGMINGQAGTVVKQSQVYETEPWGDVTGPEGAVATAFKNMAVVIETGLEPEQLLEAVKNIEKQMGRTPAPVQRNGDGGRLYDSRYIDIDIIYYGNRVVDLPGLQIPHPLMHKREFVLIPLAEIVPETEHPVTGFTPGEMLENVLCG